MLYDRVYECWDAFDCAGAEGCPREDFLRILFSDSNSSEWQTLDLLLQSGFKKVLDSTNYPFLQEARAPFAYRAPCLDLDSGSVYLFALETPAYLKPDSQSAISAYLNPGAYRCQLDRSGAIKIIAEDWLAIKNTSRAWVYVQKHSSSLRIDRELRVMQINGAWKIVVYLCQLDI